MSATSSSTRDRRSILLGGLRLIWRHPGAVIWTYLFSLGIALLFSWSLHARLSSVLDHSMAAQGLNAAFDLGTLGALAHKLRHGVPSSGASSYAGVPIYFLCYFILVPGALFSYRTNMPQRLSILVGSGLSFFWRFVRITLLAVLVSGLVLGPLFALQNAWMNHVDEQVVGVSAVYHDLVGWVVIALVAALLRVYFDLVEVYTVQLDDRLRENGKPDRRVRKVLVPAARTLWANFWRVYGLFWYTTIKGIVALAIVGYIAVESLAQPRVWPSFLLLQLGFFLNTLTRYWMRAAETVLIADFPLPSVPPALTEAFTSSETVEPSPAVIGTERDPLDAIPSPEPAVPSEAQPSPEAPSV